MKIIIAIITIMLVSCKAQDIQTAIDSTGKKTVVTKNTYKWHNFPIMIELSNTRKEETEEAVIASMKQWNDALGFEAFKYQYTDYDDTTYRIGNSTKNRIYFVTQFRGYDGHAESKNFLDNINLEIYHADILFNAEETYNFQDVLTHQLGHVLGEIHNPYGLDQYSVMNSIVFDVYNSILTTGDAERIKAKYNR
jgi:hypothetical protein